MGVGRKEQLGLGNLGSGIPDSELSMLVFVRYRQWNIKITSKNLSTKRNGSDIAISNY